MGDDEAESSIWVQFKIGAAVRKKSRVDDEIRDFRRFGCFSFFFLNSYLFLNFKNKMN